MSLLLSSPLSLWLLRRVSLLLPLYLHSQDLQERRVSLLLPSPLTLWLLCPRRAMSF